MHNNNLSFKIDKTQTKKIEKQEEHIVFSTRNFDQEGIDLLSILDINEDSSEDEIFNKFLHLQETLKKS